MHEAELSGDNRHRRLLGDGVRMVGDTSAGRMVLRFKDVLAEPVPRYFEKGGFRSREKALSDTAADIEIMIVRNLFLVLGPDFLLAFVNHISDYSAADRSRCRPCG